jgi:Fe-S-cluster containining protein
MNLDDLKKNALTKKKSNKKLLQKIKKKKGKEIDTLFHEAHNKVFKCIDCLSCANCCSTTGPRFINKDIDRISKHLNLKPTKFINKYLKLDEDNDFVLQSVPCPFLGDTNYCSIYEVRPKACAEYPHTSRIKQSQILNLNLKNTEICPAVFNIFETLKETIS